MHCPGDTVTYGERVLIATGDIEDPARQDGSNGGADGAEEYDPPEDCAMGAGAEELGHGGCNDREQPAMGEAVHRHGREQRPVSLDHQQPEQTGQQRHEAEDIGVPSTDTIDEGADRQPADDARPADQRQKRRRHGTRHAEVDPVHRDVQRDRHQGREEQELGRAQGPERAAAPDIRSFRILAIGGPGGRGLFGGDRIENAAIGRHAAPAQPSASAGNRQPIPAISSAASDGSTI